MLNIVRRQISDVKRSGIRLLGSILRDDKINEFRVLNEPVLTYLQGSTEVSQLRVALEKTATIIEDVPIVIGDEEIRSGLVYKQYMPHDYGEHIATYYHASPDLIKKAIKVAVEAGKEWDRVPFMDRFEIWDRAADLMATKYRMELNATTMLGQSKTIIQAEIDAAAELIDFFRFSANSVKDILKYEPVSEDPTVTLNSMRYRGLEGFVAAVSPFNFTAIGGNLAYTPAFMGNGVVWKPSDSAILSNYTIFKILREAGLPPGVVNFVPADGPVFGNTITSSPDLAALNFTGSVETFRHLWQQVGFNIKKYKTYPRLIGECGGKNFHFIHPSADLQSVINGTFRSAFEYCGQKCSACSRMYVPKSMWHFILKGITNIMDHVQVGDPTIYDTFMGAVIDEKAYRRLQAALWRAKRTKGLDIVLGGDCTIEKGYFVHPTIVVSEDPHDEIMVNELFGPILAVYVYKDDDVMETLDLVATSPYALTGAVFAQDRHFLITAMKVLRMSAGNFYINDKSTGSVVGQQPFGGARLSGTNDKAGGPHYVLRFASPLSVKQTYVPLREWKYPYMGNFN